MNYSYIIEPIIGAVIGYSTNWIAIKMMFRPRKSIMIGKIKVPFTPGIIPKNRGNIAKAISEAITNNLLTQEDLKENLLSQEMTGKVRKELHEAIYNNESSLKELIINNIGNESYEKTYNIIVEKITSSIYNNIKEKDIGGIITKQIQDAVEKKLSGSILGVLGGNKIAQPIIENIDKQLEDYIDSNGEELIKSIVVKEINKYLTSKIASISNLNIEEVIMKMYEKIIVSKLPIVLEKINIGNIIENKINSMKIEELENLILDVMKKELNAIINLGAVIGFVLGLFNIAL